MRIAISGAGVAGPTAAYWLHRAGHVPTLIEQAPQLRRGGYVVDFWGVGYQIAQYMGIEKHIRDAGYQVQTLRSVGHDGRVTADVDVDVFRRALHDRFVSIARSDLAAAIYASIEDDVETVFDDTITSVDESPERVGLTFAHGPPREFDLLIGADGLHSAVRALTFPPRADTERYLGVMVAAFVADGYRPRDELTYVLHNVPDRQVGRFSLRDDRTMFLFVFRAPTPDDLGDAESCKDRLREEFADVGWECPQILKALDGVEDFYCDVVSQVHLDRWSRGRTALVGDAAACVSLMAGEGTGLGMAEAYVLAGELHRAGGDHQSAFAAYEQRLRPFVADKQHSALKFIPFFATHTPLGIRLRDLGMRAMGFTPLANLLVSRAFRDDIELPDYFT